RGKKNSTRRAINQAADEQLNLEDGTLQQVAPIYDGIIGRAIEKLASRDQWSAVLSNKRFFEFLNDDFDTLAGVLASGLLASYLLGIDQVRSEIVRRADFAEGDDDQRNDSEAGEGEALAAAKADTLAMTAKPVRLRF